MVGKLSPKGLVLALNARKQWIRTAGKEIARPPASFREVGRRGAPFLGFDSPTQLSFCDLRQNNPKRSHERRQFGTSYLRTV